MAAVTVPPSEYSRLLYNPPPTAACCDVENLKKMRFDADHYHRHYSLCRGMGRPHERCVDIPEDLYITPRHRLHLRNSKHYVEAVECMTTLRDDNKCHFYIEKLHHYLNSNKSQETESGKLVEALNFMKKIVGIYSSDNRS